MLQWQSYARSQRRFLKAQARAAARIIEAAVALGVPVTEICQHFDIVSICLSKSLGAPVGSVLVGDHDSIHRARRWRKMVGGGMRQAHGIRILGTRWVFHLDISDADVDTLIEACRLYHPA